MPLITRPVETNIKEQIRVKVPKDLLESIAAYCEWQNIERDYFIEQAAIAILKKDKDWKKFRSKK